MPQPAHPLDPWYARLAFHLLRTAGPGHLTLWLILILGGLIALGAVTGPWLPGAITAVAGLTAGGAAIARRFGGKPDSTPTPPTEPDPALDPPPTN